VQAEQRIRDRPAHDVPRLGPRVLGDQGRQRPRIVVEDLALAREQRRAAGDDARDRPDLRGDVLVGLVHGQHTALTEEEAGERGEHALAGWSLADRRQQLLLEGLEAAVEEVLLGREVVEDGRRRDLRLPRDLRHGHPVEAALGEQSPGGVGDQLPRALLLALAQTELGGHVGRVPPNLVDI
jgi:hypothetical protein